MVTAGGNSLNVDLDEVTATAKSLLVHSTAAAPRELLIWRREDHLPIALHVDDRPALGVRLIERLVELSYMRGAVIGVLALGVGVMDDPHESRTASRRGPLQHLQIAVGIAKRKDRTPA